MWASIKQILKREVSSALAMALQDDCQLESPDIHDDGFMVTRDGGLVSVLQMQGAPQIIGADSLSLFVDRLQSKLSGLMNRRGHLVQVVFSRDPGGSHRAIKASIDGMRLTARRLQIDMGFILDERQNLMTRKTVEERCYIVIQTMATALKGDSLKLALAERTKEANATGLPIKPGDASQTPLRLIKSLKNQHRAFVRSILDNFGGTVAVNLLSTERAMWAIRNEVECGQLSGAWSPQLLGKPYSPRLTREAVGKNDISHLLPPTLSTQLFSRSIEIDSTDRSVIRSGEQYIAAMFVDLPPEERLTFREFFTRVPNEVPYRISITMVTGHEEVKNRLSMKKGFATLLGITSGVNRQIRRGIEEVLEEAESGATLVETHITAATWGTSLSEIQRNRTLVQQALQGWGKADVLMEQGDALRVWLETLPGVASRLVSTSFPSTLAEISRQLPLNRPFTPWQRGAEMFRSADGKVVFFEPGSSHQATWVDLYFATPGMGKSFKIAESNTALVLRAGNQHLPRIVLLDIGFSGCNWAELIRDALPEHMKDQVLSFTMQMDKRYMVNPFDTPFGCDRPLPLDREFLVNFISLMLTPAAMIGKDKGIAQLEEFVGALVDEMYKQFGRDGEPIEYEPGVDTSVDAAIAGWNVHLPDRATWWDVVDSLRPHDSKAGIRAQRYAMPTFMDITKVMNRSSTLRALYGPDRRGDASAELYSLVESQVSSVSRDYPILTGPTAFDIGNARIVAVDLMEVAQQGSASADKRTAAMYMLMRQVLAGSFYRKAEHTLPHIPDAYKAFHKAQLDKDAESPKRLVCDEYHRPAPLPQVKKQSIIDCREGRKYDVQLAFASQLLDDFGAIAAFATNIYVLSTGSTENVKAVQSMFALSDDAARAMRTELTGPSAEGSSFMYIANLKGKFGKIEQPLLLPLGPKEMLSYSTTHEDNELRKRLSAKVGLRRAIEVLAEAFPGGAKDAVAEMAQKLNQGETLDVEENGVYDRMVNELVRSARHLQAAA